MQRAKSLRKIVAWTAAALACVLAVFPPAMAALISVSPQTGLGIAFSPANWTLDHYRTVIALPAFWTSLAHSALASLGTTLGALALGIPAAYALTRFETRFVKTSLAILAVRMVPGIVLVLPFYVAYRQVGLLDTIFGLSVTYLTFARPFAIWMISGFFEAIPREIEEAAVLDGASRWTILWRILTPMAAPAILTTAVLVFLFCWNEFLFALILTSQDALTFLPLLLRFVLPQGPLYGQIFAGATLFLIPPIIALFFIRGRLSEAFGVTPSK